MAFYNFYGARKSKKGEHAIVTLVTTGENGQKQFINATIKLDASKAVLTDNGQSLCIKLKVLDDKKADKAASDIPFAKG